MNTAFNLDIIPEGFSLPTQKGSLIFQNTTNWLKPATGYPNGRKGTMVQGIFEGLTELDSFEKYNFKFTATKEGVSVQKDGSIKEFDTGATVIINTCSSLKNQLEDYKVGDELVIRYLGQVKMKNGKSAHSYQILPKTV